MVERLARALAELREEEALRLAREALDGGSEPAEILKVCQEGLASVGELFEKKQYYLSELIYSGSIFKKLSDLLEASVLARGRSEPGPGRGIVVLGTIEGDIHDLGKNIVAMLLRGAGYRVEDLGVDVPPAKFVEELRRTGARVLGVSTLLTTTFERIKDLVAMLEAEGLRSRIAVMVGGGVVDESCRRFVGADICSTSGYDAVALANQWYGRIL